MELWVWMTAAREPDDEWMEKVVQIAGALGFNPMRTRWKLMRWQERRRKARRQREQQLAHIGYPHKLCAECGAVQDRSEARCTACGATLTSRTVQVLQRMGLAAALPEGLSMSMLLAVVMLAVHARVWIAAGGGLRAPSGALLVAFGGHWPPSTRDEPWRLATAIFLHAGLWHLAFNLLAIAKIGPVIEGLYGRMTMLGVFLITGVAANLGSEWMGLSGVGIGASGGLMGLIGVAAGHGQRAGTGAGRAQRDAMVRWAAYTMIFGFAVGADHWAHAFGFVLGAVLGYAVRIEIWRRPALLPLRVAVQLAGVAGAIAAIALIFTRAAPPLEPPDQADETARAGAGVLLAPGPRPDVIDEYLGMVIREQDAVLESGHAVHRAIAEAPRQDVIALCDMRQCLLEHGIEYRLYAARITGDLQE